MTLPFEDSGGGTAAATRDDAALAAALLDCGCSGPLWESTRERLARYGVGTLQSLVLDGHRLAAATRKFGRPVRLSPDEVDALRQDGHARSEIVVDAVITGIELFRDHAILGGHWRPDGGAGLHSYFTNGCLLSLGNAVRRWRTERSHQASSEPRSPEELDALRQHETTHDALDVLIESEDTARTVAWLGPVLGRAALLRIQTGRTWADIAPEVGLSPKALERQLHRFRTTRSPRGLETER